MTNTFQKEYPLITVAIPLYGDRSGLRHVLQSVLTQTYPKIEVIISDDATDGLTEDALRLELAEFCCAPGIKIRVNPTNMGTVAHLNALAAAASGEYIKFMTSGDSFVSDEELMAYYKFSSSAGNPPVAFARTRIIGLDGIPYLFPSIKTIGFINNAPYNTLFSVLARTNIFPTPTTFYHKSFFGELGGFDESYRYLEDWPSWLRLTRQGVRLPSMDRVAVEYPRGGISSDGGGVYASSRLRGDMLLCYEKEIFPYRRGLSLIDRYCVGYFYSLLTADTAPRLESVARSILYLPLSILRLLRRLFRAV